MNKVLLVKQGLKLAAGVILASTMVMGIAGCDDGYRVKTVAIGSSYYDPFDYYYYPYSRVYFSISTGYYYYPDGDRWFKVRTLPRHYYLDPRERVVIKIKSKDQPYL
jgi:hypothetical protein